LTISRSKEKERKREEEGKREARVRTTRRAVSAGLNLVKGRGGRQAIANTGTQSRSMIILSCEKKKRKGEKKDTVHSVSLTHSSRPRDAGEHKEGGREGEKGRRRDIYRSLAPLSHELGCLLADRKGKKKEKEGGGADFR